MIIWQLGKELAKEIYELTKADCWKEDFTFRNQIRSSSGSVPDNIAEGFEREGNNEFVNFLSIAKGSCGGNVDRKFIVRMIENTSTKEF